MNAMRRPRLALVLTTSVLALAACGGESEPPPAADTAGADHTPPASTAEWSDEDWRIFSEKVDWAVSQRLDTLPLGEAMARLGETFVGTAYVPGTLDPEGPERLVINFRGLDCVTFIETVFATTRFVKDGGAELMSDPSAAKGKYEQLLADVRYRSGRMEGYPSRLHYFTDWIADNAARGNVRNVTRDLGGVEDDEPIDFMTQHVDAYRQLADTQLVAEIRGHETRLTENGRFYIPEEEVADVASRIQNGDIIAATSSLEGLDVAHTGFALWKDGTLRLMHAPLVGSNVQISEVPLAERLLGISSQDGIMVARPVAESGS